ncbi:TetR/AcrR family transcriptional regulator [Streptosporangium longisporum]|uniref:TetR/AcrR family transcriptional regulator n=1 Tax=Streptosporangium longisporum TaxID=46187 RepID=A0ABN3XYJ8_9ACTN
MSTPSATSRRERLRRTTLRQIHAVARKLLVTQGSSAVTINAVAREMGMSGPALYRYYSGYDELVADVTAGFYRELAGTVEETRRTWAAAPAARRLLAMCRALRGWAITHCAEFGWMFASPAPSPADSGFESSRYEAGNEFEKIFLGEIVKIWEAGGFPVPRPEDLAPSLRAQLDAYSARIGEPMPPAALHVFLSAWTRLYGLLCMEVMNQLSFAYTDFEPVFEECLRDLCGMFALAYEPPSAAQPRPAP